ncbi:MAG: cysteine rich repeat-containing protein [Xanthobacteraceae bacterium]
MLSMRILVISIGVITPTLAFAASPLQGACLNDVKTLCASVQPGGGRMRDCMREHRAELSIACKAAIADRMLERPPNKTGGHPGPAGSTVGSGQ